MVLMLGVCLSILFTDCNLSVLQIKVSSSQFWVIAVLLEPFVVQAHIVDSWEQEIVKPVAIAFVLTQKPSHTHSQ